MADDDQVLQPTDEEKRRLALVNAIQPQAQPPAGAPMGVPPAPAYAQPSTMPPPMSESLGLPKPQFPGLGQQRANTAGFNGAVMQEQGPGWQQINNPFLRGLAHAGSVAADIIAPRIAPRIPGTTAHHNLLMQQQALQEEQGINEQKAEAETALEQARVPALQQATQQSAAMAPIEQRLKTSEAGKNEQATEEATQLEPAKEANLRADTDYKAAEAAAKGIGKGSSPVFDQGVPVAIKDGTGRTYAIGDPAMPAELQPMATAMEKAYQTHLQGQKSLKTPPGVTVIVPNEQGGGTVQRLTAGQQVQPGSVTPTQFGPNTQMRNAGVQAELVHAETPQVLQNIAANANQIGPLSGRWDKFMQGTVGAPNQAMADLRTDLMMYSTAVALAHARGRLPENLRAEFEHAINAPQQSAENLTATVKQIDKWMADNAEIMKTGGRGNPQQSSSNTGGQPEPTVHYVRGNESWDIPKSKEDRFKSLYPDAKAQ